MGLFSWLAARMTRSQLVEHVDVVAPPALYNQHNRIGGSLTPEDVTAIMRHADAGYMYRLVDLANESRQKDCHLQSNLGMREMAVAGLRIQVTPASDDAEDERAADFTRDFLANFGTDHTDSQAKDLRHLISHLQGAHYFGYAGAETLFERDGGYLVPIGAEPIAARRFVFDQASGRIRFWDVVGTVPYPGTDLLTEFPGKFIIYQPRVNGDVESREGLMRVLTWAALFRNWGLSDWLKLAELAWKPMRIGVYKKAGASAPDIAILRQAAQQLTTNNVAVLPDTVELLIEWAKRGSGQAQHAELCGFLASEMSKAILGATLTAEQGRVGSHALGAVHNEVRHDIRDADAFGAAAIVRRQLVAPTLRMNFGRAVRIPNLALIGDDTPDLAQFAAAMKDLSLAKTRIPAQWVRARVGSPEPKDGEELIGDMTPFEKDGAPSKTPQKKAA